MPCAIKPVCPNTPSDLAIYNLQDSLVFNGVALTLLMECPSDYYCPPGMFPRTVTYPPGTFIVPIPPLTTGFPIVLTIAGCEQDLNTVLPAGSTQAQATAAANELIALAAAQQARCDAIRLAGPRLPVPITLTALSGTVCVNTAFSATISASSSPNRAPFTFIVSPQPSWMVLSQSPTQLFISGTPDTIGAVNFTVYATGTGASGQKAYTINVVGISTSSPLTQGTVGALYSDVLTAPSITGFVTWLLVSGSLPDGLSLNNNTGEISGTPTTEQSSSFTIQASNGTTACSKAFTMEIIAVTECDAFQDLGWPAPTTTILGTGAASGTPVANVITASTSAGAWTVGINKGFIFYNTGTFSYTGPGGNCCVNLAVAASGNPTQNVWNLTIKQGATTLLTLATGDTSGSYPFTLLVGVASAMTVQVALDSQSDALNTDAKSISIVATIGNC